MKQKFCAAMLFCLLFMCSACGQSQPISLQDISLDTLITVTVYDKKDEPAAKKAMELCDTYNAMFSRTITTSEISRINSNGGQPTEIGQETYELIGRALEYGALSNGKFDITIGRVNDLWDFKTETPTLPEQQALQQALKTVDYRMVKLEENNGAYYCTVPKKTELDLGGIAKGYIGARLHDYLQAQGVKNAVIDLGGNVVTLGNKDGQGYLVGIRSPFDTAALFATVTVQDENLVTSGSYERYFELDGTRYHHILDPATGWPVENGIAGVTIITEDGVAADALSTTVFAMGEEQGMALVETLAGVECIIIKEDGSYTASSGMEGYRLTPAET